MSDSTLDARHDEDGLGLVEVVVSMFLLAIISMAMIPLLAQGIRASATSAQMSTATQLVAQRLDAAKASSSSCAALRNLAAVPTLTVTDSNGAVFTQTQTTGSCPTSFPALVRYTASVAVNSKTLSTATMSILVTGS